MSKNINIYSIECFCKDDGDSWKIQSVVKANGAIEAWNKFLNKWQDDFKTGNADIPISVIVNFKVVMLCSSDDAIL